MHAGCLRAFNLKFQKLHSSQPVSLTDVRFTKEKKYQSISQIRCHMKMFAKNNIEVLSMNNFAFLQISCIISSETDFEGSLSRLIGRDKVSAQHKRFLCESGYLKQRRASR